MGPKAGPSLKGWIFSAFFVGSEAPAHLRTNRKACMGLGVDKGLISSKDTKLQWIKNRRWWIMTVIREVNASYTRKKVRGE